MASARTRGRTPHRGLRFPKNEGAPFWVGPTLPRPWPANPGWTGYGRNETRPAFKEGLYFGDRQGLAVAARARLPLGVGNGLLAYGGGGQRHRASGEGVRPPHLSASLPGFPPKARPQAAVRQAWRWQRFRRPSREGQAVSCLRPGPKGPEWLSRFALPAGRDAAAAPKGAGPRCSRSRPPRHPGLPKRKPASRMGADFQGSSLRLSPYRRRFRF